MVKRPFVLLLAAMVRTNNAVGGMGSDLVYETALHRPAQASGLVVATLGRPFFTPAPRLVRTAAFTTSSRLLGRSTSIRQRPLPRRWQHPGVRLFGGVSPTPSPDVSEATRSSML